MNRLTGVCIALALSAAVPAQPDLRASTRAWVDAHRPEILRELTALLSIPNVAADRAGIRRNADSLAGMLRRRGFGVDLLETAGNPLGVRRTPRPGGHADVAALCALRRAAGRSEGLEAGRSLHARAAHRAPGPGRPRRGCGNGAANRGRLAPLRAFGIGRQISHRRAVRGARRPRGRGPFTHIESAGGSRRRRRGQFPEPRAGDRPVPRQAPRGSDDHLRWSDPYERPADGRVWRARHRDARSHGLRAEVGRAQRKLRQLDSQPGAAARLAPRLDEERRWAA